MPLTVKSATLLYRGQGQWEYVKGSVINEGQPRRRILEVTANLSDVAKKNDVPLEAVMLSPDVKRYVEDLQKEGAVKKTGEHDYQTTLAFGLTPEGVLTMTANGKDITKLILGCHFARF